MIRLYVCLNVIPFYIEIIRFLLLSRIKRDRMLLMVRIGPKMRDEHPGLEN